MFVPSQRFGSDKVLLTYWVYDFIILMGKYIESQSREQDEPVFAQMDDDLLLQTNKRGKEDLGCFETSSNEFQNTNCS